MPSPVRRWHNEEMRFRAVHRAVLCELPDAPDDGRLIKGPRFRAADVLVRLGLARRIAAAARGDGGYYVRTPKGRMLAETLSKKAAAK